MTLMTPRLPVETEWDPNRDTTRKVELSPPKAPYTRAPLYHILRLKQQQLILKDGNIKWHEKREIIYCQGDKVLRSIYLNIENLSYHGTIATNQVKAWILFLALL